MSLGFTELPDMRGHRVGGDLTVRQKAVFDYVFSTTMRDCRQPTLHEIASGLSLESVNAANSYLTQLVAKGWLKKSGKSRTLVFLKGPDGLPFKGFKVTYGEA